MILLFYPTPRLLSRKFVNFLISRHEDDLMPSFFLSGSYTMASLRIKLDYLHNLVTQLYTDIVKPTVGNLRKK